MHLRSITVFLCFLAISSCTLEPVQPWDRDILAQKKMQPSSSKIDSYVDEHIYFSKEASSGGQSVGGGGCGCN